MNTIDTHDPFNQLSRRANGVDAAAAEALEDELHPPAKEQVQAQAEPKTKRPYVRRAPVAPRAAKPSEKPEVQADVPLVLGFFSTGVLCIQQGATKMELTPTQREQLEQFLARVSPREAVTSLSPNTRARRKCRVCQERRGLTKFDGDSDVCRDCSK
jgi:hypothetical protein